MARSLILLGSGSRNVTPASLMHPRALLRVGLTFLLLCTTHTSSFQVTSQSLTTRSGVIQGSSRFIQSRLKVQSSLSAKVNRRGKPDGSTNQKGQKKNAKNTLKTAVRPKESNPPKKTNVSRNSKSSKPPWQVLSTEDAKKNIEKEKSRRERARQGDHSPDVDVGQVQTLSTAFLSEAEQRFLNWKRFNPISAPAGMRFVGSYLDRRLPPSLGAPEVAFLGRSNVGKSSLLNRLSASAGQGDQARVGKTPGATASVNLYAIVDAKGKDILGWVDLPGFGYAKLSKDVKESVQAAAENYLGKRKELCLGILLVDIRREPSEDDRAVLAALFDMGVPLVVVATKTDKVSNNQLPRCLETIRDGLGLPEGQPLAVSSVTGDGTRDLWRIVLEACEEGVGSKKSKYDEETRRQKQAEDEELSVEKELFLDDDDDMVYSQGYDWVHGTTSYDMDDEMYDEDYYNDDNDSDANNNNSRDYAQWDEFEDEDDDEPEFKPRKENLRSLQRRAREMEKRGEL